MTIPGTGVGHYAAPATADGTDGCFVGGQLYFPGGVSLFSGNGAPGNVVDQTGTPVIGDLYIRLDGAVGSLIYRCTAVGPPPTWVVVL